MIPGQTETPCATPHLSFAPDGTARLITALPDLHMLSRLERLGEWRAGADWTATFHLRREQVQREASLHGPQALLDLLRCAHQGPLPSEIERSLDHWTRFYGHVRVGDTVIMLKVEHLEVKRNILADPELRGLIVFFDTSGPWIGVSAARLPQFRQLLAERGLSITDSPEG